MRRRLVPLLLLAACGPGAVPLEEAPAPLTTRASLLRAERPVPDQYIVVFHEAAVAEEEVDAEAGGLARQHAAEVLGTYRRVLRGFVARMGRAQAEALARHPRVAFVEEDAEVHLGATQSGATWGLDRIDQAGRVLDGAYAYEATGAGVNAYVIDTGILTTHADFGGRASLGFSAINDGRGARDCNGHGTHVAGTVGGTTWGVAKGVRLHAVRVLDCNGSGTTSGVIQGVEWVTRNHVKPAVANMSLGGGASDALDRALAASLAAGVTYVVAAGNENLNACGGSPARVPGALTVGASTAVDARSSFSNWGTCLDLFAPGSSITSAWHTGPTVTRVLSGTSMAAPHVAGAAALVLERDPAASPAAVALALVGRATPDVLAPSSLGTGSPNRLLYTGGLGAGSAPPPAPPPPTSACSAPSQLLGNPGFETGSAPPWTASAGVVDGSSGAPARSGSYKAWLNGYATSHTDTLWQQVGLPADACSATFSFWLRISTAETSTTSPLDTLTLSVRDTAGVLLATLATWSNLDRTDAYVQRSFDLSAFRGRTVRLHLRGVENASRQTSFLVDDAALTLVR